MILERFGTWAHFCQHGPKWKSRGQVPSPFGTSLAPFKMKRTKMISKGFGLWPHFSQHEPKWKSRGQFSNPFVTSLASPATKTTKTISKGFGDMIPLFPTRTKVEKQRSGSKSPWDQFGLFQNKNYKHNFKRVCMGPILELCSPPGVRQIFIRFLLSYCPGSIWQLVKN